MSQLIHTFQNMVRFGSKNVLYVMKNLTYHLYQNLKQSARQTNSNAFTIRFENVHLDSLACLANPDYKRTIVIFTNLWTSSATFRNRQNTSYFMGNVRLISYVRLTN